MSDKLQIVYMSIKDLKPYKKNAKKHTAEQINRIAESIKEFGFKSPVLIDQCNCVVAGHGRVMGAKKAGLKEVPVIRISDLTEDQVKAYRLVDNKLNESEWDSDLLNEEIKEFLKNDAFDMSVFGFDNDIITEEEESSDEEYEVLKEAKGEIPFTKYIDENSQYVVLKFNNDKDWLYAQTVLGLSKVKGFSSRKDGKISKGFMKKGLGRVVDGMEAFERIRNYD